MKPDLEKLKSFLIQANQPHAKGTATTIRQPDQSRTIEVIDQDWKMHDNFFGGEPYGGRQVIFYQNKPVWMMVYYGQVTTTKLELQTVYDFLREALQHPTDAMPYRGPSSYRQADLEYKNEVTGSIDSFKGKEIILYKGSEIFWTIYLGGLVDQRGSENL